MIYTRWAKNRQEGTCNACTNWVGPSGTIQGDVLLVTLDKGSQQNSGFRLCLECTREMIDELKAALRK